MREETSVKSGGAIGWGGFCLLAPFLLDTVYLSRFLLSHSTHAVYYDNGGRVTN